MYTGPYTPAATNPDAAVAPRRDQVYGELRRKLMAGEFTLRERLVEERLATQLGVSRTPVREALVRLLADGLVTRHDGGYYVTLPNLARLRDLYELRMIVELRGLERAVGSDEVRHDRALLEPLRDQWRAMWTDRPSPDPQFVDVDEDFHVTLLRSSGNHALTEILVGANARIRPIRMYDFITADRIETTISQHLQIVDAVLAGQLPEAIRALRRHVGESMEVVEHRAARAVTQMVLGRARSG
jgi:DNA-binding GntR family transcriptional regulator